MFVCINSWLVDRNARSLDELSFCPIAIPMDTSLEVSGSALGAMCAGSCEKPAKESAERGSAAAAQISGAGVGSTQILEILPRFYVEAAARRDG
ncbi:hypothetical protein chiPu_0006987 [Chiloscyllium punctatum]|uniref:Uncharacterized protein n=1 Tax=Chiloscyllium punctatum TaxID=137246 RepID=A0A401SDS3_CHIPU|nr:hypothetical protein [Chiloscyllium punctatum]